MRKVYPCTSVQTRLFVSILLVFSILSFSVKAQNVTVNPGAGSYATLKAAFDAINAGTHTGTVTVSIVGNTTELASAVLNASGSGSASYTSVTISPSGGAAWTVSGSIAGHLVDLNGADNVTINGLNTGGNALTFDNTSTSTSSTTIRLIADASNNTITNTTIKGAGTSTTLGSIFLSTGTTTGNIGNTISSNTITASGANSPVNGIYSSGTSATIFNSGTITGNNVSDYFSASAVTVGINIGATGNSAWTITNNKLFQTATRIYTTANTHAGIQVSTGAGYTITGNVIGFANAGGTGTTNMIGNTVALTGTFPSSYTTTGTANATRFIAINVAFTAGGANSLIQTNTVAGIALYTSSGATTTNGTLCGIALTSGNATIGGASAPLGNTIGVASGQSSLYAASTTAAGVASGIYATSANTVTIQNNTIGGIDVSGTTASQAQGFKGIDVAGAGNFTVSDNSIGNATANNIRTGYLVTGANLSNVATTPTSATGGGVNQAILSSATGNTLLISNNTIRGFQLSGASGTFLGITSSGTMTGANPSAVISSNFLGTAATALVTYAVANSGTLTGISLTNGSATTSTIQGNDIRNIVYSAAGTNAHNYVTISGTAANNISTVANNTFTNLSVNTTGTVTFISHSYVIASTGQCIINNNSIVTGWARTSAGAVTITTTNSTSTNGSINNYTNNNFSNITVTGASALTGFNNTDGGNGSVKTITGNTFNNWSGTTSAIIGMTFNFWNGSSTLSNNTITNLTGQGAITGITMGSGSNSASLITVSNNTINNLLSTGTGGAVVGLVTTNTSTQINITGNVINTLASSAASGAVTGLSVGGSFTAGTSINVTKNRIYDLSSSGATPLVSGLLIAGGTTVNGYNNIIGDLRATAGSNTTTDIIRGINITSTNTTSNINLSYNSVFITGSGGANFTTSGLYHTQSATATTAALILRNNLIVNNATPSGTGLTIAFRRSAATTATDNYLSASNNNAFYAGTPGVARLMYYDGPNSDQTLAAFKTRMAVRDQNSVTENPSFISTTGSNVSFLHITAGASQLESAGVTVSGISDDFDGDARNSSTPDIGADEFAGTISDVTAPTITVTTTVIGCGGGAQTLNATITDPSGVPTVGAGLPVIYWKINAGGYTATTATSLGGGQYQFSIGTGSVATDVISYYIVAQDNVGTPNVGSYPSAGAAGFTANPPAAATPPTTPATYTATTALAPGTYSVGAGNIGGEAGHYATLTAAVAAYNAGCLTGAVTFALTDASYTTPAETFPIAINANSFASAARTLTITPNSGVTSMITSNNVAATIDLNGAKWVTFDGRQNAGANNNINLSIINNDATNAAVTVRFRNDAQNNTVKYADVQGQNASTVANPATAQAGVIYFAAAGAGGLGNDNNTISNNNIHSSSVSVFPTMAILASSGASAPATDAAYNDGSVISNNNIYDFFNPAQGSAGVKLDNGSNAWSITNNNFYQTGTRTATAGNTHRAIWVTPGTTSVTSANGFVITGNSIGGGTAGAGGTPWTVAGAFANAVWGMDISVGLGTATSVQNNTIANLDVTTTATSTPAGFMGISQNQGNVNIGTVTGNVIGAATGTGSIKITTTSSTTGLFAYGIRVTGGTNPTVNIANNTIGSITTIGNATTAGLGVTGIIISGGSIGTYTVNNNLIGSLTTANSINLSSDAASNAQSIVGINIATTSAGFIGVTNNTIANLNNAYIGTGAGVVTGINIASSSTPVITAVTGNTVRNLSAATQTTGSGASSAIVGIAAQNSTAGFSLSNNTIHSLSLTSTSTTATTQIEGIFYSGPTAASYLISRNNIHSFDVTAANTNVTLTGIDYATGSATIQNNMIRLGVRPNGTSLSTEMVIRGISSNSSTAANNIYFNSIYIGGTGVGTSVRNTFAFTRTASSGTYDVRNNIFVNNRSNTTTGGKHYALFLTTANTGFASNYNLYQSVGTGGVFANNGTADVNAFVSGWISGDANSMAFPAMFINETGSASTGDLHVQNGSPVEGAGIAIGSVTDDFDGQTRSSLSPTDIGADAGDFAITGIDLGAISLVTPASGVCLTNSETVTISIRNYSTTAINFATNNATITVTGTGPVAYSDNKVLNSGTLAGGASMNVVMTLPYNMSTNGSYTFNASVTVSGDLNSSNNAIPSTLRSQLLMGGTYTVGAGGNYTTLTAAVADYNNAVCVSGPVTFNLTDASYSVSETFPITINSNSAAGTNLLTIKPTGTTTITGSSASALIILNGADYVVIDGSNGSTTNTVCPASTASRNLTISNTNTGTTSAVIWLQSNGTNGASNNKVINCNITGSGITQTLYGIGMGSSTISTSSLGTNNNTNQIINNSVKAVQYGIYTFGASSASKNSGNIINQNLLNSVSPNNIGRGGIWVGFENSITINGNVIDGISPAASIDIWGINCGFSTTGLSGTGSTGSEVTNATITNNVIGTVSETTTFSACGIGIVAATSGVTTISNNMIYGVSANGTSGDFAAGIILGGGTGSVTNVYHNTVSMQGTIQGATSASQTSACLAITNSTPPTVDIRNNIFSNTQIGNTGATLNLVAIALGYSSTTGAYVGLTSNYNDLYSVGAAPGTHAIGMTGTVVAGTARTTLANWTTETGADANSKNVLPAFVTSTNMHLDLSSASNSTNLNNTGTPIATITTDIDCDARSATTPDMGADEANIVACAGAVGGTGGALQTSFCVSGSTTLAATGYSTGVGSTYQWEYSNDNFVADINTLSGQTNPAGGATGTITTTTYYRLKVTCPSGTATDYSTIVKLTVNPNPTVTITPGGSTNFCPGGNVPLTASGTANTYTWSPSASLDVATGATVVASPTTTTTYTATGTVTATGCSATQTQTVTVKPATVVTAITATPSSICSGNNSQLNSSAASASITAIKITEATQFRTGTGQTPTYPSFVLTAPDDYVEISNLGAASVDVGNITIEVWTGTAVLKTLTFSSGTIIPSNQVLVVGLGTGVDNPANRFYHTGGTNDGLSSGTAVGYLIKSGSTILDVLATNSYSWPVASGVTASDWSGNIASSSGFAGVIRSVATDNNTASDWIISSAGTPQSIGTYNSGYTNINSGTFTYAWTPVTFLSNAAIANPVATAMTSSQTYTVTATETGSGCSSTAQVSVTVNPIPSVTNANTANACTGAGPNIALTASTPSTFSWTIGTNTGGITGASAGSGTTINQILNNPSSSTAGTIEYIVTPTSVAGTCAGSPYTITVTVNPPTVGGSASGNQTICAGTSPVDLTLSGQTGNVVKWQKSSDLAFTTPTDIAITATTLTSATIGNLSATTYFRAVVQSGVCATANSSVVTITVDPVSVGGTASANQSICTGTSPADLTLTGNTGNVVKWQKSADLAFTTPTDIAVTTTTLAGTTIGNLSATTYFRAVVQSGVCSQSNSSVVTVTVSPVSVGGTVAGTQTICSGTQPGTNLVLSGHTGSVIGWESSPNAAFSVASSISSTSTTLTGAVIGNLTQSTYFRAIVKSGACSQTTSASVLVSVDPVSVGGTASANQTICSGTAPVSLTLSGNTGNVVKWQKASDAAFTTPTDIAITSTTLTGATIGNLSATTYFRAVVQSGVCSQANSSTVTITVDPVSVGGTASANQTICSGTAPANLTLSGNTGNVVKWQKASDAAFTTPTDIAVTSTTLTGATIGNLSATTYFRAVVQSGVCSQANSSTVIITVDPVSVGGTVSGTQTICTGSQPGTNLVLSGNTGTVVKWQKASDVAFTTPTDIASTSTTLTGAVIGNLSATTYFRAVVQSGVCGSANSASVLVTVSPATVAGTVGNAQTICIGNPPLSDLTLSGNTGSVVKWQKASDVAFTTPTDIASTSTTLTSATIGAVNANTYFRAVVQSGACASANTNGVLISVNTTVSNATPLAGVAGGATICANYDVATSNNYLNNCELIVTVAPFGASPVSGNINACVKIDNTVQTAPTGEPFVQRHFNILPASSPTTATSTITLYFTQAEFNAFNVAKGFYAALPTGAADATGIANLRVTQYNGTGTAPGNYTGTATYINPADASITYNASAGRWSVTFTATGSGGFYVHTGKFTLPVTMLEFTGQAAGEINKLNWKTATEINNRSFSVERSADGKNFSSIGVVATKAENGNSTSPLNYNFDDVKPIQGNNYYRLKQTDKDGKVTYSQTILISRKVTEIMLSSLYPNPTERLLNLVVTSPKAEKITLVIADLTGKVVMQQQVQLAVGENIQTLDVVRLSAGTYFIKAVCATGCETAVQRFVKQ